MTRADLIAILGRIQNSAEWIGVDIVSFAAATFDNDELRDHIVTCFRRIRDPYRAAAILAYARILANEPVAA